MKETKTVLVKNHQYVLAVITIKSLKSLSSLLEQRGFDTSRVKDLKRKPIGVIVDIKDKWIIPASVTMLAVFCDTYHKKVIYVDEFISNIDKLVDHPDIKFYNQLLDKITKDKDRPMGKLILNEESKEVIVNVP